MDARTNAATEPAERILTLTRIFDAPRRLVFKAWTEPEHVMRWWGPHGFKVISCKMDFRAEGTWRLCMRGPDGADTWQHFVYREIVEAKRLVFTYAFEDARGVTGHETLVTVTFTNEGTKTKFTLHQAVFETAVVRDDHVRGWSEALDHFAEYLTKLSAS